MPRDNQTHPRPGDQTEAVGAVPRTVRMLNFGEWVKMSREQRAEIYRKYRLTMLTENDGYFILEER